jgi:hypothetical protein
MDNERLLMKPTLFIALLSILAKLFLLDLSFVSIPQMVMMKERLTTRLL